MGEQTEGAVAVQEDAARTPPQDPAGESAAGAAASPPTAEDEAREKGWRPKEEFTGNPRDWVDAEEFLRRGPLFDALKEVKSLRRENADLKKTVNGMARTFQAQVTAVINDKIAALKEQKREAIEAGDPAKVAKVEKEIESQQRAKAEIPTASEVAPEIKEWVEANPWFSKNGPAKRLAISANEAHLKDHPDDISGALEAARKEVQRAYPDLFEGSGDRRPPANAVERGAPPGRKHALSYRSLNEEQKLAHDAYVRSGVMTSQEYLKSIQEAQ